MTVGSLAACDQETGVGRFCGRISDSRRRAIPSFLAVVRCSSLPFTIPERNSKCPVRSTNLLPGRAWRSFQRSYCQETARSISASVKWMGSWFRVRLSAVLMGTVCLRQGQVLSKSTRLVERLFEKFRGVQAADWARNRRMAASAHAAARPASKCGRGSTTLGAPIRCSAQLTMTSRPTSPNPDSRCSRTCLARRAISNIQLRPSSTAATRIAARKASISGSVSGQASFARWRDDRAGADRRR